METPADPRLQELWQRHGEAPDAYETNRDLGLHLAATERFKLDALPYLIRAISFGRRDNASRFMFESVGNICRLMGEYDKAALVYRQAAAAFPETGDFALRLGDMLFTQGQVDEASAAYGPAVDRFFRNAREEAAERDQAPVHLIGPNRAICAFIGELAARPDLYLKARELGYIERAEPVLLAPEDEISNRALIDCWRTRLTVLTDPAEIASMLGRAGRSWVYLDYVPLPGGRVLRRDLAHLTVQRHWEDEGRPPLLQLDEARRTDGWRALSALGLPEGAPFVCLHVREPGFYAEKMAWNRSRHRNADVMSYLPAIETITGQGYWVVRIGDHTMTPLPAMDRVIDLTRVRPHRPGLDLFVIAECDFFVATTSGPHNVADAFGTPIVGTNWFCLGYWPISRHDVFIHKLLRNRENGRILSLAEAMAPPLFGAWEPLLYERRGLDVVDNTPDEILAAVEEMLARRAGRNEDTVEDRTRQERFRHLADPYGVGLQARAGKRFLAAHPELLEMTE